MVKVLDNEGERIVLLTDVCESTVDVFALLMSKITEVNGDEVGDEIGEVLCDVPFLAELVDESVDGEHVDAELTLAKWQEELTDYALSVING